MSLSFFPSSFQAYFHFSCPFPSLTFSFAFPFFQRASFFLLLLLYGNPCFAVRFGNSMPLFTVVPCYCMLAEPCFLAVCPDVLGAQA